MPKTRGSIESFSAFSLKQNGINFFFSSIPVSVLFPCAFVSRRLENSKSGFQRNLNERRAEDIGVYLNKAGASIPSNIVLSAQESAEVSFDSKNKRISFKSEIKGFLVLDGQHRLWGYERCRERFRRDLHVPVAIYSGLSSKEEAKLFIDINTNQRGVPAALLLDIKQLAATEKEPEKIARQIFDRLSADTDSPMRGKMSASMSAAGKIARPAFNSAIVPVLKDKTLEAMSLESQIKVIKNYLKAFDAELDDKKILTRAAFFGAVFEVFGEVIRKTYAKRNNLKQQAIQEVIRPLTKVDFSRAAEGKTKITKGALGQILKDTLRESISVTDEAL